MNKIAFKFFFFFFLATTFCNAQIKMLLLNGKTKDVKQYELKGEWVFYKKLNDPKDKLRKMDKFNVFSATNPDGTEEIIYDPDTVFEGDPPVEWVRNYIKGEQYGRECYPYRIHSKARNLDNYVGAAMAGAASGFAGFYGPIGVFIYAMGRNISKPHIPHSDSIDPAVFNSEQFQLGFRKHVRNKRIKDSLIFGGIGFAVGFAAFAVFK